MYGSGNKGTRDTRDTTTTTTTDSSGRTESRTDTGIETGSQRNSTESDSRKTSINGNESNESNTTARSVSTERFGKFRRIRGSRIGSTGNSGSTVTGSTATGNSQTAKETRNFRTTSRRKTKNKIDFADLFDDATNVSLETQTLAEVIGFPFWVLAQAGLGEHWLLDESEAKKLSKAFQTYYKSLPKRGRKASKIVKVLEKNLPLMVLMVTVLAVVAPRALQTVRMKNVFTKRKPSAPTSYNQSKSNSVAEQADTISTDTSASNDLQSLFEFDYGEYKKSN